MKKAVIIAAPMALLVCFPLLVTVAVTVIGGLAAGCAPGAPGAAGTTGGGFGIGTLNWRGAAHYRTNPHPGERPYRLRLPAMVAKVDASGASVIGFQEFEAVQARGFLTVTGGRWAIVAGKAHGPSGYYRATSNAIAYQPSRWHVAQDRYLPIRYGRRLVAVPLVRLVSTTGLGAIWVLDTHNPANAVHGTNALRDAAVRAQAHVLRTLHATEPGTPLFLLGDMNDAARFQHLFLSLAGPGWSSANPAHSADAARGGVDWIMGGPGVRFTHTVVDESTNDGAHRYTDHPFVHTTAHLPPPAASPPAAPPPSTRPGTTGSVVPAVATAPARASTRALPASGPDGSIRLGQWRLSAEELHNAQTMVSVATARGGTDAAVVIVTVALTESGLRTDPGSLGGAYGVLQQTPSAGWGTQAQVMNVPYATNAFLDHLAKVPNWRAMRPWVAAQAVQRSGAGAPSNGRANYAAHVPQARAVIAALAGTAPATAPCAAAAFAPAVQGRGSFTPNTQLGYVGPYPPAALAARMQQIQAANRAGNVDPFFGTQSDGSWYRDCQAFVAILDGRPASGYPTAQDAWSHFVATGAAHPADGPDGMSPPVGAWLYYSPNHVAVYLGNNLVAGTDTWGTGTAKIGPAGDLTTGRWHLPYLGWVTPWGTPAPSSSAA